MNNKKRRIYDHNLIKAFIEYIPEGMEFAVKQETLKVVFDLKKREVRELVNYLRVHDKCVIYSTDKGYYFPVNAVEARESYLWHRKRSETSQEVLTAIKKDMSKRGYTIEEENKDV